MRIIWNIEVKADSLTLEPLEKLADTAQQCEGIHSACAVSVRLCDDDTIMKLNQQYRSINRSTDVLSFPTIQYPPKLSAGLCPNLLDQEYDDDLDACYLGDIVISVPHIFSQAMEYKHSVMREAGYLLIHGLCHLFGYDHMEEEDKRKMREREEQILQSDPLTQKTEFSGITDEDLLAAARDAMKHSYSPYSGFPVGAALLCTDGTVYQGCNIENASFGLTNCAERTAVFKAVSEGKRSFQAIAIAANKIAWPCGACRQVLNEFAPDIRVLVTWDHYVEEKNLSELLPGGFGPRNLMD